MLGQFPASALVSADPTESRYRPIISAIGRRVADFARPAYGIEVISLDIRGLSLPEQNRAHVFDRMTAERAKIAKENRSAGELQARKIPPRPTTNGSASRPKPRDQPHASRRKATPSFEHLRRGVQAGREILRIPPHPAGVRQDP